MLTKCRFFEYCKLYELKELIWDETKEMTHKDIRSTLAIHIWHHVPNPVSEIIFELDSYVDNS